MEIDYTDTSSLYRMVAVIDAPDEAAAIAAAQDFCGTSEVPAIVEDSDTHDGTFYVTFERDD